MWPVLVRGVESQFLPFLGEAGQHPGFLQILFQSRQSHHFLQGLFGIEDLFGGCLRWLVVRIFQLEGIGSFRRENVGFQQHVFLVKR